VFGAVQQTAHTSGALDIVVKIAAWPIAPIGSVIGLAVGLPWLALLIFLLFVLAGLLELNFQRFQQVQIDAGQRVADAEAEAEHKVRILQSAERELENLRTRLAPRLEFVMPRGHPSRSRQRTIRYTMCSVSA
jgi:hypothetical protein